MSNPRNGSEGGRFRISARSAAYLQVACSLLMLFPLLGYGLFSEWQLALKEQRERISHTISVMAARQAALTRSTESLLLALSLSPEVEDGDPLALSVFLSRFTSRQRDYVGFAMFRPDGHSVASVLDGKAYFVPEETIRTRNYFQKTAARGRFSIGETFPLNDGRVVLPMAMPVLDEGGGIRFVLMAPLSTGWLEELARGLLPSNGESLFLFDAGFNCLFPQGQTEKSAFVSQDFFVRQILPRAADTFPEMSPGSRAKTFSFAGPDGNGYVGAIVALRLSRDDIPYLYIWDFEKRFTWLDFGWKHYPIQITGFIVILLLSFSLARIAGKVFFTDGLEKMADVAERTRSDLSLRAQPVRGCREIGVLAGTFDRMLDTIQENTEQLRGQSLRDPLTGLWNRRHFLEAAVKEVELAARHALPLALGMADIDHFKAVNDNYGHLAGDEVLRRIASLFQKTLRGTDIVARFGGEEFVLLFPHSTGRDAAMTLERVRRICADTEILYGDQRIRVTVSFGVSEFAREEGQAGALDLNSMISNADSALYKSKNDGRNRVTVWERDGRE